MQRNGVESRIHILGDIQHHIRICCIGRGCCCSVYRELSAPSVVSAEDQAGAVWYGTLRVGVGSIALDAEGNPTNKAETKFNDAGSRFGIKGSSEISEGLTAVYNFEHKINTANASLAGGGRLSYAGLSGGFGKITAGQIWSASYNSVGAITDNSTLYGDSETSARHGNVISYANTFGPASVQLDLMFDGGRNTGKDIDQVDFGLTVELGDIGKIAIAHIKKEDSVAGTAKSYTVDVLKNPVLLTTTTNTSTVITTASIEYRPKAWEEAKSSPIKTGTAMILTVVPVKVTDVKTLTLTTLRTTVGDLDVSRYDPTTQTNAEIVYTNVDGVYHPVSAMKACKHLNTEATDGCKTQTVYVTKVKHPSSNDDGPDYFYYLAEDVNLKDGSTSNHIAAEFSFGGITPYIGYAQKKMEKAHGKSVKDKTTFFGVRGSLGDTGLSYLFQYRDKENADGTEPEPWILGLSKTMGGGASLHLEHSDPGVKNTKSTTAVWLKVDF